MPKIKYTPYIATFVAVSALMAGMNNLHAAGFQLKEQSAEGQGNSFAGATATANDLSTIYFNPAGMTRLSGTQGSSNFTYVRPSSKMTLNSSTNSASGSNAVGTGTGGDAGSGAIIPTLYGMYDYSPDLKFGIAVNTPFGLSTEYDDDWVGRYHALKSEIKTINIAPSVAYRVNKNLSVGVGAQIQYVEAELTSAVNGVTALGGGADGKSNMQGDDIGFGARIGLLYEFNDDTRVGFTYHSRVRHKLEGQLKYQNLATSTTNFLASRNRQTADHDASAKLTTPDIFSLGVSHQLNDKWTLLGELSRTQWTTFGELRILDDNGVEEQNIYQNYKASHFGALGANYQIDENSVLRFGVAYDQGAVDTEHRTARIPDADRYWVSLGYGYQLNNFDFNVGYTYIKADDADVYETDSGLSGSFHGTYESDVNIFTLNATYRF